MKTLFCILGLLTFISSPILHGDSAPDIKEEGQFYLSFKYASPEFLLSHEDVGKTIVEHFAGHYKWFLLFHNVPENESIVLKQKRELAYGGRLLTTFKLSSDELKKTQASLYHGVSGIVVESVGYFPGEEVTFIAENQSGKFMDSVKFTPWPLISFCDDTETYIEAKLANRNLTIYHVAFHGFKDDEKLTMISASELEVVGPNEITTKAVMLYSPDVKGVAGGTAKLTFKRGNKDVYSLNCPWGNVFDSILKGKVVPKPKDFKVVSEYYSS